LKRKGKQAYLDEFQLKCSLKGVILLPEKRKKKFHENYNCKSKGSSHLGILPKNSHSWTHIHL
jgi:hypothetical protein